MIVTCKIEQLPATVSVSVTIQRITMTCVIWPLTTCRETNICIIIKLGNTLQLPVLLLLLLLLLLILLMFFFLVVNS